MGNKVSNQLRDIYDANCNSCRHLERVQHAKDKYGFLFGNCKSIPVEHPFALRENGNIMFHPHDIMMMACYKTRHILSESDKQRAAAVMYPERL